MMLKMMLKSRIKCRDECLDKTDAENSHIQFYNKI